MIEILILFIIIIVAFAMMRGRGLVTAKIDKLSTKKTPRIPPAPKLDPAPPTQKITKIKWRPQVQVREYYKDGTVADVSAVSLND